MKKNLLRSLLLTGLTLLSVGVFTSCSDDDNNDKNETKNKTLLSRIAREDFAINYEYDAQNRLIKITETDLEDESSDFMNISYDNQGRIFEFKRSFANNEDENDVFTYTYAKDTIFKANNHNSEIDTLYINSNNQLLKASETNMTTKYEYNSDGDLVKSVEIYTSTNASKQIVEVIGTRTLTYSSGKGILLDANIPSWFVINILEYNALFMNKSCIIDSSEYITKIDGVEKSKSINKETWSYTYDKSGKPVEVTFKDDDNEDKYTLTYIER